MSQKYKHLDIYSDLVRASQRSHQIHKPLKPGKATQRTFLKILNFAPGPEKPRAIQVDKRWKHDEIDGELVTWSVGYGPRTGAYVLKPSGVKAKLPGVLALHDHGAFKTHGKEKIADGSSQVSESIQGFRDRCYEGVAFANRLAKRGYVVLVPDCFLWGSRRFPLRAMEPERPFAAIANYDHLSGQDTKTIEYNSLAAHHEHLVEKYCRVLGTTLSGVISYEDRVAVSYLLARRDVVPRGAGCIGLSGGGLRAGLLQATCNHIRASVVVGMMTTYSAILDHNVRSHTWMLYPADWARHGDYPDAIACRVPSPLMVQYNEHDELFTLAGMKAAHRKLAAHYRSTGRSNNYVGRFYPGSHKFDLHMQDEAFDWLDEWMQNTR